MIAREILKKLAIQYHTTESPNIVREYCQHLLLSSLYKLEEAGSLLFKGGTAFRILYGSPRFSEDLDFTLVDIEPRHRQSFIEHIFASSLAIIEQTAISVEFGSKFGPTTDGYYAEAIFHLYEFPPVKVAINISSRNGEKMQGETNNIASDFLPPYNIIQLSQDAMVEEKIFGALINRQKPRDFYDLYFILRKGLFPPSQKKRLAEWQEKIVSYAGKIDFKHELSKFLPFDHQNIIKDFKKILDHELRRQLASS